MGLNNVLKIAEMAHIRSSHTFDVFDIEYTIYHPMIFCEYSLSQKNRQLYKTKIINETKTEPPFHS